MLDVNVTSFPGTTISAVVRPVSAVFRGVPTSDGAGVKLTRVVGQEALPDLDPFLLLDEFGSDDPQAYIAGFPEHPHRGFETVTYMLAGRMRHRDNQGNSGLLTAGSVQWMTAGRGIVHSEMPEQEEGLMQGFQLWVNLPASDKMTAPRYQDIAPERIPQAAFEGGTVRVIAGRFGDVGGPVTGISVDPTYLDVALDANASFRTHIAPGHTAFLYAFDGGVLAGDEPARPIARGELAVLGSGDTVAVRAGAEGARFILVAGRPLREPIARYGPIVMNTRAELVRAFDDLRNGTF
jgi:redox-sensitive bicupin YhaK (pirin superfamily)